MGIRFAAPWLAAFSTVIFACASTLTFAQSAQRGLRDALEAAWARQPQALAKEARAEEFAARRSAAEAFFPGPPAFGGEHWTDALNRNQGFRKFAGEIAVPLWLPGQRDRAQVVVAADREFYDASATAAKLKLAGEVRDAYWLARSDAAEVELAKVALATLMALEADVKRRSAAGELARVDANRAEAETHLQRLTLAEAEGRAFRSARSFLALTGMPRLPDSAEDLAATPSQLQTHPALLAAAQAIEGAQARLRQVAGDTRDAPEFGVGTFRERNETGRPWEQIVTFRVRIPFGAENRNRPRVTAANVELIEAQALRNRLSASVEAEASAASQEADIASAALPLARRRTELARDTHRLFARGFAAGEFDFTTRLRAERELREAELADARAQLAAGRAASRLKQAYGVLP